MTVTGARVRDYTDDQRTLTVEIQASPAYELVLSLFAFGCRDRSEYEVGQEWFSTTYQQASPELQAGLDAILAAGEPLVGMLGMVYDLPEPRSIPALLEHVAETDPLALRVRLLESVVKDLPPDDLQAAAAGDHAATGRLFTSRSGRKHRDALGYLLAGDAEELRDRIAETMRRFAGEFMDDLDQVEAVLDHDAREKEALAGTLPPERLVEAATNGVTFAMQPEVSGVVLIPAIVTRPWVVIAEHGPLRIFAYPVADESLAADPEAPPDWMVKFYKALGDERRLRILRILSEGPANLGELAERTGVAKPTAHHHVSMLRRAGLVRVTVGTDKDYSLRDDAVPQAGELLAAFLQRNREARISAAGSASS